MEPTPDLPKPASVPEMISKVDDLPYPPVIGTLKTGSEAGVLGAPTEVPGVSWATKMDKEAQAALQADEKWAGQSNAERQEAAEPVVNAFLNKVHEQTGVVDSALLPEASRKVVDALLEVLHHPANADLVDRFAKQVNREMQPPGTRT